ncbi:hypothetical protein CPLU01_15984, partial [Colletotrichum plurivorum]
LRQYKDATANTTSSDTDRDTSVHGLRLPSAVLSSFQPGNEALGSALVRQGVVQHLEQSSSLQDGDWVSEPGTGARSAHGTTPSCATDMAWYGWTFEAAKLDCPTPELEAKMSSLESSLRVVD